MGSSQPTNICLGGTIQKRASIPRRLLTHLTLASWRFFGHVRSVEEPIPGRCKRLHNLRTGKIHHAKSSWVNPRFFYGPFSSQQTVNVITRGCIYIYIYTCSIQIHIHIYPSAFCLIYFAVTHPIVQEDSSVLSFWGCIRQHTWLMFGLNVGQDSIIFHHLPSYSIHSAYGIGKNNHGICEHQYFLGV